jgi:hypothetical protein
LELPIGPSVNPPRVRPLEARFFLGAARHLGQPEQAGFLLNAGRATTDQPAFLFLDELTDADNWGRTPIG